MQKLKSPMYCFVCSCFRCWFVRLVIFRVSFAHSYARSFVRLSSSAWFLLHSSVTSFARPCIRSSVRLFFCSFVLSFGHRSHYSIARRLIGLSVAFVVRSFGRSLIYSSVQPGRRLCYIITFYGSQSVFHSVSCENMEIPYIIHNKVASNSFPRFRFR